MPMISLSADHRLGLDPAAALFRGLADSTRLALLQALAAEELRVVDLTARTGLAQSTVSEHLACLRGCGLVTARTEGRQSYYSIDRPELLELLSSAEALLASVGTEVALCPTFGTGR